MQTLGTVCGSVLGEMGNILQSWQLMQLMLMHKHDQPSKLHTSFVPARRNRNLPANAC